MKKTSKKIVAFLTFCLFALSLVAAVAPVAAATNNIVVGAVPNLSSTGGPYTTAQLRINEEAAGNFAVGDVIVLTLPGGVTFNAAPTVTSGGPNNNITTAVTLPSPGVANITLGGAVNIADNLSFLNIAMAVNVTSMGSGDLNVNVAAPGTAITEGNYTIARFVTGSATASALTMPARGGSANYGTIRIVENSIGALAVGDEIKLSLPNNFTWGTPVVTPTGTFTLGGAVGATTRVLTYTVTAASTTHPAIIDITTPVTVGVSAAKGDVIVSFGGVMTGDVKIGSYADFGVTVTAAAAKDVIGGKDDQRIANVTIKEAIAGSLINARTITVELPVNTRFNAAPVLTHVSGTNIITSPQVGTLSNDDRIATFTMTGTSAVAAEMRLENVDIDVAANVSGPITAKVAGNAGAAGEVVVANAVKVISLKSPQPTSLAFGFQDQLAGDIAIIEGAREALGVGIIVLNAPSGVTFANVPTVEVVDGNIGINATVARTATTITITVDAQSTVASTIKVSNIKLTADRTVPEGPVKVSVTGNAVMQNTPGFANVSNAGAVVVADVSTTGVAKVDATFQIGSSSYVVNGVTRTMDVSPYIKDGRTMLPVRYIADALGVTPGNIFYSDGVVTIIKGDRVVQLTIGSKDMYVNGAKIQMDIAAEIVSGRTMLPLRFVGTALGADIQWHPTTQTITVK